MDITVRVDITANCLVEKNELNMWDAGRLSALIAHRRYQINCVGSRPEITALIKAADKSLVCRGKSDEELAEMYAWTVAWKSFFITSKPDNDKQFESLPTLISIANNESQDQAIAA